MSDRTPILEFIQATFCSPQHPEDCLREVTMALEPGAAAVVETDLAENDRESGFDYFPLADAAQGLLRSSAGTVRFLGRDWDGMPPLEQMRNRGRIGRVFDFHGWVHNLTVMENLILACRTHRACTRSRAEDEAEKLARRFGLDGVPAGRPALFRKRDLRRCEWVRAFLGAPHLVILERPELDAPKNAWNGLLETAQEARGRGAAVLWITQDREFIEHVVRMKAERYAVCGRTWSLKKEEASP